MKKRYITLEEFADRSQRKINTIKKNHERIPGVDFVHGEWVVLEGSRYPYNVRRTALVNDVKKKAVLLKAIYREQYIDSNMLKTSEEVFKQYLKELKQENLIKKNKFKWFDNVNRYSITEKGVEAVENGDKSLMRFLAELFGIAVGNTVQNMQ